MLRLTYTMKDTGHERTIPARRIEFEGRTAVVTLKDGSPVEIEKKRVRSVEGHYPEGEPGVSL